MLKIFILCLLFAKALCGGPIVMIVGTRPEAIKMIPVYQALKDNRLPVVLCSTGQHAELLDDVFKLFEVTPQRCFHVMKPGQSLSYVTKTVLERSQALFKDLQPSLVIVQGDTTSALSGAMAAFYEKIPVAHVEAGLRSNNILSPFPEEMNRRMLSLLARYHFAPTEEAASVLLKEGIDPQAIFVTGNTVVDALYDILNKIEVGKLSPSKELITLLEKSQKLGRKTLLLTAHRRESFNGGIQNVFSAIKTALSDYHDLHVIYPVHPNPAIQTLIKEMEMDQVDNLTLLPPLPYHELVYLLHQVDGIATDSGGIQEEGVSLNKPVFVLRNETDRPEGITRGTAMLIGTDRNVLLESLDQFMKNDLPGSGFHPSIYGDGNAAQKIADIIEKLLDF